MTAATKRTARLSRVLLRLWLLRMRLRLARLLVWVVKTLRL
jgi:hypothetical protein